MSVNDESTVSRQFEASGPSVGSTMTAFVTGSRKNIFYAVYTVLAVAVFALTMVSSLKPWRAVGLSIVVAIVVLGPLIGLAYLWWRSNQKVLIGVTPEGLTVNRIPGVVFSIADATMGPWVTMGVAAHLQSGSHRFVLGGRDRRITPTTQLDAPPVQTVNAWLWDADFAALLTAGGVNAREPGADQATRCLLYPNPYLAEELGSFAVRKQLELQRSLAQPSQFIDVDSNAIRVVDPSGKTPDVSAPRAQATGTPSYFQPASVTSGDGSTYNYPAITGLVLSLPGMAPLTIGCLDMAGSTFRFSWRGEAAGRRERPAHVVSAGDLLTLVEAFGLTAALKDGAHAADG
jgi:hypothetical protein